MATFGMKLLSFIDGSADPLLPSVEEFQVDTSEESKSRDERTCDKEEQEHV